MNNKFLLLLGANQFQRERALIGAEKAYHRKIVTISPTAPIGTNKYPAIAINSTETNPRKLLRDIINYCKEKNTSPIAVVPLNDFVLNAGYLVAKHFDLPYNSEHTIKTCRTKDIMKKVLISEGLPVVPSYRFKKLAEAKNIAKKVHYPLVVKPLNFGGSGGVIKVENQKQLEDAIKEATEHLKKYAGPYDSDIKTLLMEPYIKTKQEVSVEVINTPNFREVIGVTDKFLGPEPYFSEIGHLVPSAFHQQQSLFNKIKKYALDACKALNIQYGMAHVEMKVDNEGNLIIIEVGVRTAGDSIMDLYEKATGINIYELHCKAFLGQLKRKDLPRKFSNIAAIGYLHPAKGIISAINSNKLNAKDLKNIDLIAIRSHVGQKVDQAKDWSTRYGFVEYSLPNNPKAKKFNLLAITSKITKKIFFMKQGKKD